MSWPIDWLWNACMEQTVISKRTLALFHKAAKDLPGYKAFLAERGIKPDAIDTIEALLNVPVTSKKNYLTANRIEDLIWEADQTSALLLCATSGSTGEPYYFPRNDKLSWQYSRLLEDYLKSSSYGKGRTLVLIGFGMGVWIGGIITLRAFEIAGERLGEPLSILPTGYNKTEIFKALRKLSPDFDQTIIVGYPPFIKELVDEAPAEGIDLTKLHMRFLFAAEAFNETFRNYVCQKAGVQDPLLDTLNIYGSADIGAMANETPLSILIRRLVIEYPLLYRDLFGQIEKTPTLAQYNPDFIEFEAIDNDILLSANGALPLIRYAIGDHGGVLEYDTINDLMKRYDISLETEIQQAGIAKIVNREYPFVYVYERADLSVTLQGLNIYPEFIKEGLLQPDMTAQFTERFTMATKNDIHHNQFLQINLELQKGVEANDKLKRHALKTIETSLIERSSEFAEVAKTRNVDKLLQVVLWPNGHPRYFTPGTKQKWVEKQ